MLTEAGSGREGTGGYGMREQRARALRARTGGGRAGRLSRRRCRFPLSASLHRFAALGRHSCAALGRHCCAARPRPPSLDILIPPPPPLLYVDAVPTPPP